MRGTSARLTISALLASVVLSFSIGVPLREGHATKITTVVDNRVLDFNAATQSIWGPGSPSSNFNFNQLVGSTGTLGIRLQSSASTGTVSANYDGALAITHTDKVLIHDSSATPIQLAFNGNTNGGTLTTDLGAELNVTGYVLGVDFCIYCVDYKLDIDRTFTPQVGPPPVTGSDSFTSGSIAVGPDLVVASAQAGVDLDIVQNASFQADALNGTLVATHLESGIVRTAAIDIGATDLQSLSIDLSRYGLWSLQVVNLSLANSFATDFDLDAVAFAQYTIGLGCGDPGDNSDNGLLCGGDGRLDHTFASIDLFTAPLDTLAFNAIGGLAPFTIEVVPEPASLLLFSIALIGLGLVSRRRRIA